MENNMELEQMKAQMELLKGKLEKQELVNEQLIAESMKHKMSWIKKFVYIEIFCLPLTACMWFGAKTMLGLSWWNFGVFVIGCILDTLTDYNINIKSIKDEDYAQNNLIDTMQKLQHMKHSRFLQMLVSVPILIMFMGWTFFEAMQNIPVPENGIGIRLIIGLAIGLFIALYLYKKLQNTNDEVIKDIKELQEQ